MKKTTIEPGDIFHKYYFRDGSCEHRKVVIKSVSNSSMLVQYEEYNDKGELVAENRTTSIKKGFFKGAVVSSGSALSIILAKKNKPKAKKEVSAYLENKIVAAKERVEKYEKKLDEVKNS